MNLRATSNGQQATKANILEIFRSIQGEGKYAGIQQIFVRFFECNMHCVWCDTPHSIGDTTRRYDEYDEDQLIQKIVELNNDCHSVSITGGEPLLQAEFIKAFIPRIKEQNLLTYLETNGVLPNELGKVVQDIDIIAMDMKLPSSTECRPYWDEHEEFLRVAKGKELFIKTVISSVTEKEEVLKAARMAAAADPNMLFILQPNFFDMKNGVVEKCEAFQKDSRKFLKDVRIIPQMHKMLKVR
ncbi:MAG: 7-carboxy-7-deazaguanine synthase QueE [Candidatus Omnitrophica bacterium]|nr:7-carboxy-7-deazaguanine synthase QueE [Candidatus Omnitrophota bacterium]